MFDVGFSEMLMIGIVALVVIGPERLPRVARTAGLLLGRMRRYVSDIKADIDREMQLEELKRLKDEMQESARELERSITSEIQSIEQSARAIGRDDPEASASTVADSQADVPLPANAETEKPVIGTGKD
jgi:sec-independent protein translocase protein TatB